MLARMGDAFVEVTRGSVVESRHRVHVAVVHAERGLVASAGDPHRVSFVRSAIKAFQVLPFVGDGGVARFGLTGEELAICTASHGGEPFHVRAVRSLLDKIDAAEGNLACGAHPPLNAAAAETLRAIGVPPSRIHNNCSGKHAGMLALARLHDWPLDGYHRLEHPVQQRVRQTLASWCGVPGPSIGVAVDGCGLPTFALPLDAVAHGCARFAAAAADGMAAPAAIHAAMTSHPEYVAGTDRLCTVLMQAARGRLFAKVGAEGYYCAGIPDARLGVAIKVEDGAWRAVEPALLATLRALDALSGADYEALGRYAQPTLLNTRGEVVGQIRAAIALQR